MKIKVIFLFLLTIAISCKRYEKLPDGVLIHLKNKTANNARFIKLQVISDKIIHVIAGCKDSLSETKSLMVLEKTSKPVSWKTEQNNDEITIHTASIIAHVMLSTGEITFTDTTGQTILQEQHGGGKTFHPVNVDGKPSFQVRQVFESPSDEAFYGLGQHQYNIMNYKGKDIDLYQYNTKISIPFVVSNRNYGILWDNNARSKFGDIRDYGPISKLKLYSPDGVQGGLTATYVDLADTSKIFTKRTESDIDYAYIKDQKKFPKEFTLDKDMVRWTGFIESDSAPEYKFNLYAAGYIKAWIDGKLVIDRWRQGWNPTSSFFNFPMEKGKKYPIRIEWKPDGSESYISLKCLDALPKPEQEKLSLYSEMGNQIDYYFIKGDNLDQVISGYRELTGRAPIMPKWALGLWQSRERYKTQDEILSVVSEFRKRKIPIDNIVLDWQYWKIDQWGSHEFDSARFPDPAGMVNKLHADLNAHIMISVWPKFYVGTNNYKIMNAKGFLYKPNVEKNRKDWIGYVSTFYDPFNAEARKLFWSQVNEKIASKGFDGWWLDASEPDICSNLSMDERKALMNPTALGPATEYFNAFPLQNEKGIYEGLRETKPDQRVFILTRSAFAGSQRYSAASWSGDIGSRWEEMKLQIPAATNFSISGIPYWTMDIGGFALERRYEHPNARDLDEWRELNTRWLQFGAFVPLFRVHGQFPYREMFNIAPDNHPAYQSMLWYNKFRYRLMPYIYTLAAKTYYDNYTIMRPLVMDFANDKTVLNMGDQYMFGPALMVCPVYEYKARSRKVYLPSSTGWFDLYTGNFFEGGKSIDAEAPLSKMPVFVKQGSILPFGPEIQYASEKTADPITLYIYTGKDALFTLYEDENINYNYEKDKYANIPMSYNEQTKTLTIEDRKGSFPGMQEERTFHIVWVTQAKPSDLNFNKKPNQIINYNGTKKSVKME
jgi:alpha-D-xyloside xylohydrolase